MGHKSRPMVRTKVPEIVLVTRNSAALVDPMTKRAFGAGPDEGRCNKRSPTSSANGVQETSGEAQKGNAWPRSLACGSGPKRLPEHHTPHNGEIGVDQRLNDIARSLGQQVCAEGPAEHPRQS